MAINPIHVIFGLKLRQARLQQGLSVTELAARCGLSPSYLTEIEKGRKYPKADKILRLARALHLDYDRLVSLSLDPPLAFLEQALSSQAIQDFPLQLFGLDPAEVVKLLTRSPAEVSALARALGDMARGYNIQEEHFFRAALRSYQEIHENYFPDLEEAAERFAREHELVARQGAPLSEDALSSLLTGRFGYTIGPIPVERYPELASYRAIFLPGHGPRLLVNPALLPSQRKFVLAREIGYRVLGLHERALTNSPERADSFTQVLNDFKAAYVGGALLMPRDTVVDAIRTLFSRATWHPERLAGMLEEYDVTPETLLYRFSELIPRFFGLKVHFLRFNEQGGSYRLYKQLNMSQLALPHGFDLSEHFCRRWLTVRIIRDLAHRGHAGPIVGIQRSRFLQSGKEFVCLGFARQDNLPPFLRTSVILGLRVDDALQKELAFRDDPAIPEALLNETCERCPLSPEQCPDRAAPPVRFEQDQLVERRRNALEALMAAASPGADGVAGGPGTRAQPPATRPSPAALSR
ncbi:MAG: helix-turn-helix domain-containing protein [Limnochordaceae bacterium]|nr:helix-turn-helix domain-containing protein [Limnochordaceae bacterium]